MTSNGNPNSRNTNFNEQNLPLKRRSAIYAGTATSSTTPLLGSSGFHMPTIIKSVQKHEEPTRSKGMTRGGGTTASTPFTDHTNLTAAVPGQQTGLLSDAGRVKVKDEEQVGMWIRELKTKGKRGDQLGSNAGDGGRDETPQKTQKTTCNPPDRRDSGDELRLRSRFSEHAESTRSNLPELPKPIGYANMSPPVFTNPFGGNTPLAPLLPLTRGDYIPLPDVFRQPGGYKEPPVRKPPPPTEQSKVVVRAKDISPFDTSEMTQTDRKLLKRILFEESKRASRKPPLTPTKPGLVFRARQREIKARKPGHRPLVPPHPKRSLVFLLPYFHRRGDAAEVCGERGAQNADEGIRGQEGGFSGFVRWAIPRGMAKWVLRQ